MKIAHILDSTLNGGTQAIVFQICKNVRQHEHTVLVLGDGGAYSRRLREAGAQVIELGEYSRWNPFVFIPLIWSIYRGKFDVVNTYLIKSHILGGVAAYVVGVPFIIRDSTDMVEESLSKRGYFGNILILKLYLALYVFVANRSCRVIVLTHIMREKYFQEIGLPASQLAVVPSAVRVSDYDENSMRLKSSCDVRHDLGISEKSIVVVRLAALTPVKDWITFLKVAQYVQAQREDCYFLVVGDGPLRERLREYVEVENIQNVIWLGHRNDISSILHDSDIFLHTSLAEAFPLVLLEAMAAGLPVVSTNCNGPTEMITSGVNGLLADVGDWRELSGCVLKCITDHQFAAKLGRNAYRKSRSEYDTPIMARRLAGLYSAVKNC